MSGNQPQSLGDDRQSRIIIAVGLFIMILGIALIALPEKISGINVWISVFLACFGLGIVATFCGSQASYKGAGYLIDGAGAIAIIFFLILHFFIPDGKQKHTGLLRVISSNGGYSHSSPSSVKPRTAVLSFENKEIPAEVKYMRSAYVFEFVLDDEDKDYLSNVNCPSLNIEYSDGTRENKTFYKEFMLNPENKIYFHMIYKLENKTLFYEKDSNNIAMRECDPFPIDERNKAKSFSQTEANINKQPLDSLQSTTQSPVSQTAQKTKDISESQIQVPTVKKLENSPVNKKGDTEISQPTKSESIIKNDIYSTSTLPVVTIPTTPMPKSNEPSAIGPVISREVVKEAPQAVPSQAEPQKHQQKFLGYVIIAELSSDMRSVSEAYFSIDKKPHSWIPAPNDIVTGIIPGNRIRLEPFHWDASRHEHVKPDFFMTLRQGEKARVGGDSIIGQDPENKNLYIFSPITEIIGQKNESQADSYPKSDLPVGSKYVYLGYLNDDRVTYSTKIFENYSNPEAIYPSPEDILLAVSDVWVRPGPRQWDLERQIYVMPPPIMAIHKGDYVRVSGNAVLANGGLSLWAPIDKIFRDGPPVKPNKPDAPLTHIFSSFIDNIKKRF